MTLTPIILCKFDEAASGVGPTSILDYSPGTPLPLTPTYSGTAAWSSVASGRGLTYGTDNNTGCRSANVTGTKFGTAVNGATKFTWELVIDYVSASHNALILDCTDLTSAQICGIWTGNGGGGNGTSWEIWSDFSDPTYNFTLSPPTGLTVVHVVFDSTQALAANRVKVYYNGVSQTLTAGSTAIPLNRTLVIASGSKITASNPGDVFSPLATHYFIAAYGAALSPAEVSSHASLLAANNDSDPNTAIVHVQSSGKVYLDLVAGPQTVTMPGNFTAGSTGVLILSSYPPLSAGPVTINGVSATRLQATADGTGITSCEIWVADNLPGGAATASITTATTGGQGFNTLSIEEFSGLASPSYDTGTVITGTATGGAVPATIVSPTWAQANTLVIAVVESNSGQANSIPSGAPGAPWISVVFETDGLNHQVVNGIYQVVSSVSSVSASWTLDIGNGGTAWGAALVGLKAAGGTPTPTSSASGSRLSPNVRVSMFRLCG